MFIVLVRPPAAPLAAGESQRRAIGPPAAGSESAPGSHTLPSRQQSQYTKKTANRNNEHSSSAGLTGHPSNPPILQQTVTVTPEKLVQHLTSCMFTTEKNQETAYFFSPAVLIYRVLNLLRAIFSSERPQFKDASTCRIDFSPRM